MSAPARPIKPPKGRTIIAFLFLDESAGWLVLVGTILVVAGIVIISWKPGVAAPGHRWWHVFYSLGAGLLARFRFSAPPLRTITNEPVFFVALIAAVLLGCSTPYFYITQRKRELSWHARQGNYAFRRLRFSK